MKRDLVIVGAGGAGVEALWVARRHSSLGANSWNVIGFVDDNPALAGTQAEGLEVLGTSLEAIALLGKACAFHCAVGDNRTRRNIVARWVDAGFMPATLIDVSAVVAESATIGPGSYVGPHSIIAPHAKIGRHALINVQASVGHHSVLGDYSQLCPGARASGFTRIGEGGFVGSNGVLAPGVSIGSWSVVAAASFAARDIADGATAIGVPARELPRQP